MCKKYWGKYLKIICLIFGLTRMVTSENWQTTDRERCRNAFTVLIQILKSIYQTVSIKTNSAAK